MLSLGFGHSKNILKLWLLQKVIDEIITFCLVKICSKILHQRSQNLMILEQTLTRQKVIISEITFHHNHSLPVKHSKRIGQMFNLCSYTLRKFQWYNKASLGELVPLVQPSKTCIKTLNSGNCSTCLATLWVWARVAQNVNVYLVVSSKFYESACSTIMPKYAGNLYQPFSWGLLLHAGN